MKYKLKLIESPLRKTYGRTNTNRKDVHLKILKLVLLNRIMTLKGKYLHCKTKLND